MHLLHFLYRGESDHLTLTLSYYSYLYRLHPELCTGIDHIMTINISKHKPQKLLLSDPYSVCREI